MHSRLNGLDLARYLSFVGMVVVNFKVVMGVEEQTSSLLSDFIHILEGKAAATFVVLAGLGLALAARASKGDGFNLTILKRALFLLAIGLLNTLIFEADILHYYAVYFALGVFFVTRSTWQLVSAIAAINLAFVLMLFFLNYEIGWNWKTYTYSGFWTPEGFIRNLFFNGWHPVIPWIGFLFFGFLLARLDLSSRKVALSMVVIGFTVAIAVAFTVEGLTVIIGAQEPELLELLTTSPIPPMPFYTITGMASAAVVTGGCLLLSPVLERIGIARLFAAAGKQTLTLYIAHIIIGMGILESLGLLQVQLFEGQITSGQTVETVAISALLFCAGATLFAYLWSLKFKRGPIEIVMRRLAG